MVECEYLGTIRAAIKDLGFNRYMVECELVRTAVILFMFKVLIDTWWNVNVQALPAFRIHIRGFNRYMVECEFLADS